MVCKYEDAWWVQNVIENTDSVLANHERVQRKGHRNPASKGSPAAWNSQAHYNMSVRREMRKRGILDVEESLGRRE